jgi:phosphoglycerol transferase MdoB-like AlkP superfamily enzyme
LHGQIHLMRLLKPLLFLLKIMKSCSSFSSPRLLLFAIAPVAAIIIQEMIIRGSFFDMFDWILLYPKPFAVNVILAAIVFSAFTALTGKTMTGIIFGAILLMILTVINIVKMMILHVPFFGWDLIYAWHLGALAVALFSGKLLVLAGVLIFAVFLFFLYRSQHFVRQFRVKTRLSFLVVTLMLSSLFFWDTINPVNSFNIRNINWNQTENYATNGFLLAFSMNIAPALISAPEGYSRDMVASLVDDCVDPEKQSSGQNEPVSLVILMSEGFSLLSDAEFEASDDSLKNIKQLSARYPSFTMVSPTFAGNTSLVEFEVLTGLSNAFLPSGAIPFDHYLRRPTPSLASILKNQGYQTVAVHPFHAWFWSRDKVYPNLGFERFISLEQFEGAEIKGKFTSDKALVDKMIDVIESTEGPYLIYAVSMQNHMPYLPDTYGPDGISVIAEYPERLRKELETYLTGLRDADRELARLTQYLTTRKEPVILLFFGDHQPNISPAYYHLSGTLKQGLQMEKQLSEVPALLWSNKEELVGAADIPSHISPSYISGILLRQMGIVQSPHMVFTGRGLNDYPVIHRNFIKDGAGELIPFSENRQEPFIRGLEILTYDVLFGKQFSSGQ